MTANSNDSAIHPQRNPTRIAALRLDHYTRGELEPPFRPGESYPELGGLAPSRSSNTTYGAVRRLLALWSGGAPGTSFSPFSAWVEPGMQIVLKPNLVLHQHPAGDEGLRATVTDAAVIRPVLDYLALALRGQGTVVVAESPLRMTDFGAIVRLSGLDRVLDDVASTWKINVELVDIRDRTVADASSFEHDLRTSAQPGDPRGSLSVDLGPESAFEEQGFRQRRLRSTAAVGRNEASGRHRPGRHVYALSRSVLEADLVVSMPKLKTHKKAGITCALKNYVGTVVRKEWLPHHRQGPPDRGGDEYPDDMSRGLKLRELAKDWHLQSRAGRILLGPLKWLYQRRLRGTSLDPVYSKASNPMLNGGWHGNDTCWRMVHDVYRIFLYAAADGKLADQPARRQITLADGLIAGEGDGPLKPTPRNAGLLLMGADPAWTDFFATLLMGYEPAGIPLVARAVGGDGRRPLTSLSREEIELACEPRDLQQRLEANRPAEDPFVPPAGWARRLAGEEMFAAALAQQYHGSLDY